VEEPSTGKAIRVEEMAVEGNSTTTVKFKSPEDRVLFEQALQVSQLTEAQFLKRHWRRVHRLKNFRRSQLTRAQWRRDRWKMLRGIRRFHRSTEGKRFHRKLARFLALRDMKRLMPNEAQELLVPLTSALTHALIESQYWIPELEEAVDYALFLDEMVESLSSLLSTIREALRGDGGEEGEEELDLSEWEELVVRLTETAALVKALADRSGRPVSEVERLWDKAKRLVQQEYGLTADSDRYWALVVAVVKRMLGLSGREGGKEKDGKK